MLGGLCGRRAEAGDGNSLRLRWAVELGRQQSFEIHFNARTSELAVRTVVI